MAPEIREKFQKLSSIDQKLAEAEKAAAEKNPDIKTARENLLVLLDEVAKQVRELEEKTDDAVVKASPDLAASVKEKQTILAELEDQMAQYKSRIWLMRLSRVFGAGQGRGGWGQGHMGQPGAGPGAPQAPPAEQPK
jgi:DNA repair exonuclease SbcCD ATPase subunit